MTRRACAFSDAAGADLTEIALFIAVDNPIRALRFVEHVRACCPASTAYPERCRMRDEYGTGVRVAVHGRCPVFYAERGNAVVIERILHGAPHLDWVQL